MLEVKIVRAYADRSVTKGLLIVDGKQIGHTMEKPQQSGAFGKCLDVGAYHGKIVCTQYSPFTIKVTCCGRRFDSCLIPQGDYEKIMRGICIGRNEANNRYALKDCDKVFRALERALQNHICKGDRKISVEIIDDAFIEKTDSWRQICDETEDDDFFNEDDWD